MKSYFPFTDYDFWAYISSGFVFLFALDHTLQTAIFQRSTWTIVEGLIAVAVAYVVGHLLAGLASAILERRFVGKYLGRPSVLPSWARRAALRWFRSLYPEFYEALPQATIDKILSKARIQGISESGEALFWLAYDHARKRKARANRVGTFLNLYGLCRNLSMTAIIVALMLIVSGWHRENSQDYWWAVASAILGAGMFLRYLKFYRHYSLEVFTALAYSKGSRTNATTD
jgi:hypothetical protein